MQAQATEPPGNGICIADGYGLKITVSRSHLLVHDGIGRQRQTRRYHRATSKLTRLVLIGHTGYITLDALRWLHDIGAALVHIDADAKLLATSTASGPGHAGLRRGQALAGTSKVGVEIARDLLGRKVTGQHALLAELPGGVNAADTVRLALRRIRSVTDLPSLLGAEAEAASAYWAAWSAVPIPIGPRDIRSVPEHWRTFGKRHSLLSNGPRVACNPPNAILNYLYALLEAEATLALHAVGLDPLLGIFHTDQRHRNSLALDAMEPIRPIVDAYVLALLTQRTLARDDFVETRQGSCRITTGLAARLAETTTAWRHHIGPVVERIAQQLNQASQRPASIAAPLTRAQHHAAWSERGADGSRRQPRVVGPKLANACRECGAHLPDQRRRYCEKCRATRWTYQAHRGRQTASTVLASLRAEQRDPAHGGQAAANRGRKNAEHQQAIKSWKGELPDPARFAEDIQPQIRHVPIEVLVEASGLSEHYCSLIRLGKRVPHPRHWEALRACTDPSFLSPSTPLPR